LIGRKTSKNNFWKSSILFGEVIHLIGGVGGMRRPRLTQSNLIIGPWKWFQIYGVRRNGCL